MIATNGFALQGIVALLGHALLWTLLLLFGLCALSALFEAEWRLWKAEWEAEKAERERERAEEQAKPRKCRPSEPCSRCSYPLDEDPPRDWGEKGKR